MTEWVALTSALVGVAALVIKWLLQAPTRAEKDLELAEHEREQSEKFRRMVASGDVVGQSRHLRTLLSDLSALDGVPASGTSGTGNNRGPSVRGSVLVRGSEGSDAVSTSGKGVAREDGSGVTTVPNPQTKDSGSE